MSRHGGQSCCVTSPIAFRPTLWPWCSRIPEALIRDTIALLAGDSAALLTELSRAVEVSLSEAPRRLSFAVLPKDEEAIEEAITQASAGMNGPNQRGRALALTAQTFLGGRGSG